MHYSVTIAQLYTCIQCFVPELWFGVDECGEGWTHYWSIYGAAGSISQYRPPATCQSINTSPLGKFWENRGKNINQNKHSNKYHFMIPPICSIIMLSAKHYFVLTPFLSKILLVLRCILNGATTTWHFVFDTRATPAVNISRSRCTRPKISYEATMMQCTPSIIPHQRPARQKQIVAVFHLNLKCIKVHWRAFQRQLTLHTFESVCASPQLNSGFRLLLPDEENVRQMRPG